ncbi:MAG TPA: hypothetical protein VFL83_02870 [Anaeromyxobacter sp.]|nr:hypothetical protein [Anaeromyxobacter sp.]
MTDDRDETGRGPGEEGGERAREGEAPDREAEPRPRVPAPAPEEAPELLGERSDYPIAWEPDAGDER